MSALFRSSPERARIGGIDVGLLDIRDRACLRLLRRIEVATPDQLAILARAAEPRSGTSAGSGSSASSNGHRYRRSAVASRSPTDSPAAA